MLSQVQTSDHYTILYAFKYPDGLYTVLEVSFINYKYSDAGT